MKYSDHHERAIGASLLNDDIEGRISSVLDLDGLSLGQSIKLLHERINGGASSQRMLAAAISLLRDQARQIADLKEEVLEREQLEHDRIDEYETEIDELKETVAILRAEIASLMAWPKAAP